MYSLIFKIFILSCSVIGVFGGYYWPRTHMYHPYPNYPQIVSPNTRMNPVGIPDTYVPMADVPVETTQAPVEPQTTTPEATNPVSDLGNVPWLCGLKNNWNLPVVNGWLHMSCFYDYANLDNMVKYSLRMQGFLTSHDSYQNAWLNSLNLLLRDGYVSICTLRCSQGTKVIPAPTAPANEISYPQNSLLNIGCSKLYEQKCEAVCQEDVRIVRRGKVECTKGLFVTSQCTLQCEFGYYATGPKTKVCDKTNKKWTESNSAFKCKAYTVEELMVVLDMLSEEEVEGTNMTNTRSILKTIETHVQLTNKTDPDVVSSEEDMYLKNEVLGKIISAFSNKTETSSIVLKSLSVRCSGDPEARIDCGFPGITENQCENNDCCYDDSIQGVAWCFRPYMGERPVKDSTTRLPYQTTYNSYNTEAMSYTNPFTTLGTFNEPKDLIEYLDALRNGHNNHQYGFGSNNNNHNNNNYNNNYNHNNGNHNNGNHNKNKNGGSNFQSTCSCTSARSLSTGTDRCDGMSGTIARVICGSITIASEWPWHVVVYYQGHLCGATLIANNYVVTAAHCVNPNNGKDSIGKDDELLFGVSDIIHRTGSEQTSKMKKIHRHPEFKQLPTGHIMNDIAVIELETPVKITSTVRPICLPGTRVPTRKNKHTCFVTGFGKTGSSDGGPSQKLRYAKLPITDTQKCLSMYNSNNDINSVLCAGKIGVKSADTCRGDSGGPLFCTTDEFSVKSNTCTWYLAGVTSFGNSPCGSGFPGVYVNVGYYEDWIRRIVS